MDKDNDKTLYDHELDDFWDIVRELYKTSYHVFEEEKIFQQADFHRL
jgi:hypothetical protein